MFARLRRAWGRPAGGSLPRLAEAALDDGVDALAPRIPVAALRDDLIACAECDALHRRSRVDGIGEETDDVVPSGRHYECRRCGATLGLARHASFDLPLALALAGLVALAIAHLNDVLLIDIQGQVREATVWQAAWTLYDDGAWFMCGLVLFTTLLNPLVQLGAAAYVLLPLRHGQRPPGFDVVLRAMEAVRPWVMVEVFMLGVLVAYVKLNGLASVVTGPGLWAFAAVMILAAAMASAFDHEHVWASTARLRAQGRHRR
ncbi:MAG TPA: paraquat-inducible protein A [Burkholderiaceae bacterium]|jgi:paraquat-inducible protein A|nr:paraquat-inducible protein A [Burkholderiaceae bacterium]